jgi:hypothetical protein
LNRRPPLFEGTTNFFSGTSRQHPLDVAQWSRTIISGPGHNRGSRLQIRWVDWGLSVQIIPRPGFERTPAFPGNCSLSLRILCVLKTSDPLANTHLHSPGALQLSIAHPNQQETPHNTP